MLLTVLPMTVWADEGGEGTATVAPDISWYNKDESVFVLNDEADLLGFNTLITQSTPVTFLDKTVKLGANMDLSGCAWIGTGKFYGTFDGQGHTITGLTVTANVSEDATANLLGIGMFGTAKGLIQNFSLVNSSVEATTASASYKPRQVAAVVGNITGDLTISNVSVAKDCSVTAPGDQVGGILGVVSTAAATVTVKNCTFAGSISAKQDVGGIVGSVLSVTKMEIQNCTFAGEISATNHVGGIAGYLYGASLVSNG